jgi:hypothetical protein
MPVRTALGGIVNDDVNKDAERHHRFTRRTVAWVVGCAALLAATSAAGVASNSPRHRPKPAAQTSNPKNALDAILLKNPKLGQPVSDLIRAGLPKPTYRGDTGRIGLPAGAKLPNLPAGSVSRFVPGAINGDFNLLQLAALALSAGCPASAAPIAAAIAAAESGGNPGAQGDISLMDGTWDWSQGLWQIRGLRAERGTGGLRDSLANANPVTNARAMYIISSGCTDWTPWSTYTSGAYLAYLGLSKNAALAAQQYHERTGSYPPFGPAQAVAVPASPQAAKSSSSGSRRPGKPTHKGGSGSGKGSGSRQGQTGVHRGGTSAGQPNPAPSSSAQGNPVPQPSTTKPKLPLPTSSLPVKLPPPPSKKPSLPVKLPTSSLPVKVPKPSLSVP